LNPSRTFHPPWWSRGGDFQTIWAPFFARSDPVDFRREIWETPDGDRVAVDWVDASDRCARGYSLSRLGEQFAGTLCPLPRGGLRRRGWAGCFINFRGCGGINNFLPRGYHAGDSAEIRWMLERASALFPRRPRYAVGVSLAVTPYSNIWARSGTRRAKIWNVRLRSAPLLIWSRRQSICNPVTFASTISIFSRK
jgi:Predicted hydrolase of the alpha/beta-hydrolase fold